MSDFTTFIDSTTARALHSACISGRVFSLVFRARTAPRHRQPEREPLQCRNTMRKKRPQRDQRAGRFVPQTTVKERARWSLQVAAASSATTRPRSLAAAPATVTDDGSSPRVPKGVIAAHTHQAISLPARHGHHR